ncbi:LacI family DNA-binding transcriptional regulator [Hymenobacter sp.]|uniref:LacI family DNA-binding transcriptional regulator n=1 Tax=Hymenobacter sp. TaxID=1898978 RepID=UPI00286AC8BD|nr:LacI family DNA-binding transcriptional regulator [Hymenobacter sp.]
MAAASKSPSIYDLAEKLKISVSTVSRALQNHPKISQVTKRRVLELARQLNYQPNQMAKALSQGHSKLIGVLVPHIDGFFFGTIVRGIETAAHQAGYHVLICQSYEDATLQQEALTMLLQAQVAGILVSLAISTPDASAFAPVLERHVPLVLFDRFISGFDVSSVVIDDYQGAYDMTTHLLAQGARRIAHLAGPQSMGIFRERLRGFQAALHSHNAVSDPALILFDSLYIEGGIRGMTALLQLPQPPDAVFAANDFAAIGALQVLKEKNLRVPEDLLLAGFGDELTSAYVEPPLSTVNQLNLKMGEAAVQLLLNALNKTHGPAPHRFVLKPELIVRRSSNRQN